MGRGIIWSDWSQEIPTLLREDRQSSLWCLAYEVKAWIMPTPISLPFPPLVVLELDGLVTWDWLEPLVRDRLDAGVSLCIVGGQGATNRGGYFFHLREDVEGFAFSTFDRQSVLTFGTGEECAAFMNHVSGRLYDENMWARCQEANLKTDEEG